MPRKNLSYAGDLTSASVRQIAANLNGAILAGGTELVFCLSSTGGGLADAIYLYNFIRALPVPLLTYNIGSVSSAAVLPFLAGEHRYASPHSTFMLHQVSYSSLIGMDLTKLKALAEGTVLDERRLNDILRERANLPAEIIEERQRREVFLSPDDALRYGLIEAVENVRFAQGDGLHQIML